MIDKRINDAIKEIANMKIKNDIQDQLNNRNNTFFDLMVDSFFEVFIKSDEYSNYENLVNLSRQYCLHDKDEEKQVSILKDISKNSALKSYVTDEVMGLINAVVCPNNESLLGNKKNKDLNKLINEFLNTKETSDVISYKAKEDLLRAYSLFIMNN